MSELSRALVLTAFLNFLSLLCGLQVHAQSWLPGYNYRKKITINKALVDGNADLQNFQLLVALEHADLKYVAGACSGNKISGTKGRDFAFTTVAAPQTPLSFQLDEYVPETGRLVSWLRLNSLAAAGSSTAATQIYLYYGSNTIHFPASAAAQHTWSGDQDRIWHMNPDVAGTPLANAATGTPEERLFPATTMNAGNIVPGKIGNALTLNGSSQYLTSAKINSDNFTISCWIKFNVTNREQVILSTDSTNFGGYTLKLDVDGRLVQETRSSTIITSRKASLVISPNRWYHVVSQSIQGRREFIIDGISYSGGLGNIALRTGGTLIVGANKQQGSHFSGMIDELRIQTINPGVNWLKTTYNNQRDPAAFYVVAAEERNSVITATGMLFRNVVNQDWLEAANWNSHEVPGQFEQVVIDSGAVTAYSSPTELSLNKLALRANAKLSIQKNMEVFCDTEVETGAELGIGTGQRLQLDGHLLNDGLVGTGAATAGSLVFSGALTAQQVTGLGRIAVAYLVLDKPSTTATLQLQQPVNVYGYVQTIMGKLHSNGYLALKQSGAEKQAYVWPIPNVAEGTVVGEVTVEQYVTGAFPAPATARNWRLLSTPVYHGSAANAYYHLYDLKAAMFVTGPGGANNGFDDSPQNGHTIYTHNQSVVGGLAQKYTGVTAMQSTVDVGRGIYVFSRGGRQAPDALTKQLLRAPFQNPESYIILHKGLLFQGDLQLQLQNRNMGEAGDGFNLLGNPYAATISWAALQKENLSPYVWKFNPLNNAYDVSSDPNTSIAAGEGFFVKVLSGHSSGSLRFSEAAKRSGSTPAMLLNGMVSSNSNTKVVAQTRVAAPAQTGKGVSKLTLTLVRTVFAQTFNLVLSPAGQDEVDDLDAMAMGSGYVGLSSIAAAGTMLSVDTRRQPGHRTLEVPLYVKGYQTGTYELHISGIESLEAGTALELVDAYLNTTKVLQGNQVYTFEMNTGVPESFGEHRFALRLKAKADKLPANTPVSLDGADVVAYPNPFVNGFKLSMPAVKRCWMELRLYDLVGKVMLRKDLGLQDGTQLPEVDTSALGSGIYLMELINRDTGRTMKMLKLVKR